MYERLGALRGAGVQVFLLWRHRSPEFTRYASISLISTAEAFQLTISSMLFPLQHRMCFHVYSSLKLLLTQYIKYILLEKRKVLIIYYKTF